MVAAPLLVVIVGGLAGVDLPGLEPGGRPGRVPVFAVICLIPQRIMPEATNPISRFFIRIYLPVIHLVLKWRKIDRAGRPGGPG